MNFDLPSFEPFIFHKNQLLREGKDADEHLSTLANSCLGEYNLIQRELMAQVKNLHNQSIQMKVKCNSEIAKLQSRLEELVNTFYVVSGNCQLLQVLPFITDEELKIKLKNEIRKEPFSNIEQIKTIPL